VTVPFHRKCRSLHHQHSQVSREAFVHLAQPPQIEIHSTVILTGAWNRLQ